jgi:hypothetical protein
MKSYTLRPDTFTLNFNVTLSGTALSNWRSSLTSHQEEEEEGAMPEY